jgi:hypothetical protein
MRPTATVVALTLLAVPLRAGEREDREKVLRQFFEGRSVTVYIDMPATSKGIDVYVGRPEPLEPAKVQERVGGNGVAIRDGQNVRITRINLKDDTIEFQLDGGGFNWFWDSSGSVSTPYSGKSTYEADLERDIKRETDPKRKRDLQRDLDRERNRRYREEQANREIAEAANEIRREKDRQRALDGGSRFNIRFVKKVPPQGATPDAVMEVLSPWVDFSALPGGAAYAKDRPRPARPDDEHESGLRAGLSRSQVASILGPAEREESKTDGDLHKAVAVFRDGGHRLELTFVNGILVQFKELP